MMKHVGWYIFLLAMGCSGCGKITYTYPALLDPAIMAAPRSPVLVAVQDQRSAIVSGQTSEKYAGVIMSWWPTPLESVTRRPLAEDVAESVARNLEKNGVTAVARRLEPDLSEAVVQAELMKINPGLVLFVAMRELKPEWNTESGMITFHYDLGLQVYDQRGEITGAAQLASKDVRKAVRGLKALQNQIAAEINARLTALLNDPSIAKALQ